MIFVWQTWLALATTFDEKVATSLSGSLNQGSFVAAASAAWVGGVLTSLTPCVYPLIPITVRYFGGMSQTNNKRSVLPMAISYVLGMAFLYATLGSVFASLKLAFGTFLANPWVVGAIVLFCVAMGLSMLGAFSLQLPASLNARLSQVGGQSFGGAFAMGLVSGLIAAPCTGPVLAVILALIASSGNPWLGFGLMTSFALGLGLPFLLLAVFSGSLQRLPRGGAWMELVKLILASAMFVVALYFAQFVWPQSISWTSWLAQFRWLVPSLLGFAFLLAVFFIRRYQSAERVVWQWSSLTTLTVAVTVLVVGGEHSARGEQLAPIAWLENHDIAMRQAQTEGRPVMIDFTADWCVACKELEKETYVDPKVQTEAKRFVNIKIDSTTMTDAVEALFSKYKVVGLPTVLFLDSRGQAVEGTRLTGFVPPERFLDLMKKVQ